MHILLIDESKRGRQIVCRFLTRAVPDAQVHEFHPLESGKPDRDFEWSAFDVVILGQNMSGDESGLDWFRGWATLEEYPPTILLTAKDESKIVAEAARLGAQAVICKRDLTPALLAEAVHAASERRVKPPGRPAKRSDLDAEIVSQSTDGDGYDLGRLIGHGGMSRVYLAKRRDNGAIVVLKVMEGMMEADNDPVRRFALEAELASKTESRHVVRIFDRGFTDHFGFIAMEYLVGGDLKERISQGLKAHDALSYALQIAHGLEAI
ncbi:MAG: protein kinase, partial [Chromatiales bacterium]|nr:protein kinase [Chromatiales bacterium]